MSVNLVAKTQVSSSGLVLFLEEDQYLSPDALHVIKLAESLRSAEDFDAISLGELKKSEDSWKEDFNKVSANVDIPPNLIMTFLPQNKDTI